MDLSRRTFLRGLLTVSATSVVPLPALSFADYPVLYGEGIHDDAPALNALFSGEPYVVDGALIVPDAELSVLRGGRYLVSRTLVMRNREYRVTDALFEGREDFEGDCLLRMEAGSDGLVAYCQLRMRNEFDIAPPFAFVRSVRHANL